MRPFVTILLHLFHFSGSTDSKFLLLTPPRVNTDNLEQGSEHSDVAGQQCYGRGFHRRSSRRRVHATHVRQTGDHRSRPAAGAGETSALVLWVVFIASLSFRKALSLPATLSPFLATELPKPMSNENLVLSTKSKQIEHVQFVSTLSKGRNFTINCFNIVAVCGNKVECCFDKVERCFDIVAGVDGAL